jgi:hypothetical protein
MRKTLRGYFDDTLDLLEKEKKDEPLIDFSESVIIDQTDLEDESVAQNNHELIKRIKPVGE